ncbi:hypothetical protein GGR56DRAFT_230465 [Xylariaceae sp. FL0804]|nr:hypothetical protein GGR56DRAFT_230465 [Xylariaceae sp. FL0804]
MAEVITETHGINLPPRYQIRRIDFSVRDFVIAMGIEGFMLRHASLWKPLLPHPKVGSALRAHACLAGHYDHAIHSGLSFCIVDTQYRYRRPGSAEAGGWLYWDELDPGAADFERRGHKRMLHGMDFPIVCIALAFDAFSQRSYQATADMLELIPLQSQLGAFLKAHEREERRHLLTRDTLCQQEAMDPRPPETWAPTGYGHVLMRSGCVTKPGYERRGLATALNRFVMLEARALGFRGLSVGMGSRSMLRCYVHPPRGCASQVVAHWNFEDIQMYDEEGNVFRPYLGSGMRDGWEVWIDLTG